MRYNSHMEQLSANGYRFGVVTLNDDGIKNLLPHMDANSPVVMPIWVKEENKENVVAMLGSEPPLNGKHRIILRSYFTSLIIA